MIILNNHPPCRIIGTALTGRLPLIEVQMAHAVEPPEAGAWSVTTMMRPSGVPTGLYCVFFLFLSLSYPVKAASGVTLHITFFINCFTW